MNTSLRTEVGLRSIKDGSERAYSFQKRNMSGQSLVLGAEFRGIPTE